MRQWRSKNKMERWQLRCYYSCVQCLKIQICWTNKVGEYLFVKYLFGEFFSLFLRKHFFKILLKGTRCTGTARPCPSSRKQMAKATDKPKRTYSNRQTKYALCKLNLVRNHFLPIYRQGVFFLQHPVFDANSIRTTWRSNYTCCLFAQAQ